MGQGLGLVKFGVLRRRVKDFIPRPDPDKQEPDYVIPPDAESSLDLDSILRDPSIDQSMKDVLSDTERPSSLPDFESIRKQYSKSDPVEKIKKQIQLYKEKPLYFWRHELGIPINVWPNDYPSKGWDLNSQPPLWSKQREIIEALVKHRKVAVKSGHGIGKSFISAGITLYLAYIWHCIGLTTAPTFRQVRRILWSEIRDQHRKARHPLGGKMLQTSLELGDRWFVEGFATDSPSENIQGIHEENVFVIVDEAGGVHPEVFDALDAILTSKSTFVLYIGNPISGEGPFFNAFKPDSGFHKITISCYDSPNVKHKTILYPKLTTHEWVKDKEKKWGTDSSLFRARVLGEFPEESKDTLIPLRYINDALERDKEDSTVVSFGVDVARQGSDRTVYGKRMDNNKFRIIDKETKKRVSEISGRMINIYREETPDPDIETKKLQENARKLGLPEKEVSQIEYQPPCINVDEIGVGGGVCDILIEENLPTNSIDVGRPPEGDNIEDLKRFLNQRAQHYWHLRDIFINGEPDIDDEELAFELSKIRVVYLRSGKIKIADKDDMRKEIGRSPDLADNMMLTFAKGIEDTDRSMVRWVG